MKHSVYFDTKVDSLDEVLSAVNCLFGLNGGQAATHVSQVVHSDDSDTITMLDGTVPIVTLPTKPQGFMVDSTGIPFDERIHQNSQTTKGVWKKRKGVDEATRQAVEAELRGGLAQLGTPDNRLQLPEAGVSAIQDEAAPVNELPVLPGPLDDLPSASDLHVEQQAAQVASINDTMAALQAAQAAAAAAQAPIGQFEGILASHANEPQEATIAALTNEVSLCVGNGKLKLDDLAQVACQLTGTESTASGFFTLLNSRGFWPNIAKSLDALVSSQG